jgi:pyridinium-3,5-biscarboxylic acid mononucleotide sulfurtransferase
LNMSLGLPRADLQVKIEKAVHIIGQFNGAVVALSAGVDSSLVAALARKALGDRVAAVTAVSESLAPGEIEIAKKTARRIGIRHIVVATDEVHNASYATNPTNRCYYCKDTLYRELRRQADRFGLEAVLDGTQLDDLGDTRPGLLAAKEAGVRSPLAEAGFSKKDVRETAHLFGLKVWDKPAMPCLSSRIPHGEQITVEKLSQVGQAESTVKRLSGARDIRVRHHGEIAAIEVSQEELPLFHRDGLMNRVKKELRLIGFTGVIIGPRKYPSGPDTSATRHDYLLPIINASNH